jgi:hypothetical protein
MKRKILNSKYQLRNSRRFIVKVKNLTAAVIFFLLNIFEAQAQIWEQTNGPFGCFISSLAVHPNGDLYAGVSDKGLYRSTNNGYSWNRIGFTGQFIQIQKIFISNSGYIFLQVWDQQYNIFRSKDNGATWQQLNINFNGSSCFEDDGIGNIYISFEENNESTILRSTDGGDNWAIWSIFMGNTPNDLLFYDNNNYIFLLDGANRVYRLFTTHWVQ